MRQHRILAIRLRVLACLSLLLLGTSVTGQLHPPAAEQQPAAFAYAAPAFMYAGGVPYCWCIGFCSYEGKTAWMTDKVPNRKFDKFAQ